MLLEVVSIADNLRQLMHDTLCTLKTRRNYCRFICALEVKTICIGLTSFKVFKVARYPEFSRSTNLESKLIKLFVF